MEEYLIKPTWDTSYLKSFLSFLQSHPLWVTLNQTEKPIVRFVRHILALIQLRLTSSTPGWCWPGKSKLDNV